MTYEDLLADIAADDERIVVMTAENRAAIRNIPRLLGDRFIDVGIAEQTMVGAAAGLALRGRIPIAHALASFLTLRAFEFVRTDLGIGNLPVKLVGGVPGLLSEANGPTHQAIEDVALMRGIPTMKVFAPADIDELLAGLPTVINDPSPWYIRFNTVPAVIEHTGEFAIGRAEIIDDGPHGGRVNVTILVYGFLFGEAIGARDILQRQGVSTRVVNLRCVKPIDVDAIVAAAMQSDLLVTLEDHFLIGGLYSILGELSLSHRFTTPVLPIGFRDRWFRPGLLADVLRHERMTAADIAAAVAHELASVVNIEAEGSRN